MKKLFTILALAATVANAQYVDRLGNYLTAPPSPYAAADGRLIFNPSWSHILADGGREATAQETADWQAAQAAAAQAAANAQAEAEAQAKLPQTFPTGIAVTNAAGHWVEFVPDGTNVVAQTLAIQVSQSPLTPEQREAMKAAALAEREAKRAKAKAAKAKGNGVPALAERVAALEAMLGVE